LVKAAGNGDSCETGWSMPPADIPLIRSWVTPKARKGEGSAIEGRGVHATEPISPGEVVAIKGGHIVDRATVAALPAEIQSSGFQIAEDCFLAALDPSEYEGVMMLVNHSCDPNVGMAGNVLLVSMRDVAPGEELTIDYCLFMGDPEFSMICQCGATACRQVIPAPIGRGRTSKPVIAGGFRGTWFAAWRTSEADRGGGDLEDWATLEASASTPSIRDRRLRRGVWTRYRLFSVFGSRKEDGGQDSPFATSFGDVGEARLENGEQFLRHFCKFVVAEPECQHPVANFVA
jgi:uncharacterized protein